MTERQVQLIADFCPDIIMVTPSYLLAIADEFARQKLDARRCSLKVGIFGAEPWTEAMRGEIEACFDLDALDIYGLSEVIGPGVSCECIESKDGLHVWEDHFYPEVVDPVTGEVLPDGQRGELVLTSLTKEAMPVVRYRTRDLTRLLPGTARSMRRMEKITGRSDDMLIVRGVNLFPSQIEELILADRAAGTALRPRGPARAAPRRGDGDRRSPAGRGRRGHPRRREARSQPSHQVADRHHDQGPRGRARPGRPLARQGKAHRGSSANDVARPRRHIHRPFPFKLPLRSL